MRPKLLALLMLTALVGPSGCAGLPKTPVQPPRGRIFESVQAPLSVNYQATLAAPAKTGRATYHHVWIPLNSNLSFSWQSVSIENAVRNGGLSEVEYVDYKVLSVLGVYTEFTIIAHGN
jgi:hypothetical protein